MGLPTSLSYGKHSKAAFALWFQHIDKKIRICTQQSSLDFKRSTEIDRTLSVPSLLSGDKVGVDRSDTQKGMLSGISQERNLRSKI